MKPVPVWIADESFRAAVAQLPGRARSVDDPAGSICVVPADGPMDRIAKAARSGSAIVLTRPWSATPRILDAVAAAGVPVIVHRSRLRADHLAEAAAAGAPRLIAGDVQAGASEFAAAVTDAIGWIRVLCDGPVALRVASGAPSGAIAALEGPAGVPATLLATRLRVPARPAIVVRALAPVAVEVEIDDAAGIRRVRVRRAEADQSMAPRWESAPRMTLRRALEALEGAPSTDLADLAHDSRLAAAVLGAS